MRGFSAQKLWSHISLKTGERTTNREIREAEPREVLTFSDLVKDIARISVENPEQSLFFRGQPKDYLLDSDASSSYPKIYRSPGGRLSDADLKVRFDKLDRVSSKFLDKFREQQLDGREKLSKFPELCWAILQHYLVCETPLLDVTHSLRVAASFSLAHSGRDGMLLAYGFPYPTGSITYSVEQEFMIIRLLSICPPQAARPYFQEGFLVGTFPVRGIRKHPSLDVCTRLLGKFKLRGNSFWNRDFQPIPRAALYPEDDVVKTMCDEIEKEV